MKKILIVLFLLFISVPVLAEKSDNISLTAGWEVWYERGWSDEPVIFHFENVSGQTAFKITAVVNGYDRLGNYVGRIQFTRPGPIHEYFIPSAIVSSNIKSMTAEVYNIWEYNP